MREKEMRVLITFASTTNAMGMEKICKSMNYSGRLIPIPRQISAGCGLAWMANPEDKEEICHLMKEQNIIYDTIYEIEM